MNDTISEARKLILSNHIFKTRNVGHSLARDWATSIVKTEPLDGARTAGSIPGRLRPPARHAPQAACLLLRCTGAVLVLQPHRRLHHVHGRGRCSPGLVGGGCGCTARSLLREDWSQRTEQRNSQCGEKRRRMGTEAGVARRRRDHRQNPP